MTDEQCNTRNDALLLEPIDGPLQTWSSPESPSTLLPRPIASIVSLATATASLGLRIGGFIGGAAISGARIGTLTSFELGRVVIEGLLARAGSDVVDSSLGDRGKAEAEGLLERALSTLHYTITSTSFLVSAGFQIGSSSLSSGLAISQFFLSGLDAVLGDTESSKAVTTIVVLVQREFKNPETGISGERVGLGDLIVGVTAFALLQRWGRKKTEKELDAVNATELVWDVVLINDEQKRSKNALQSGAGQGRTKKETVHRHARPRAMSFVSATGNHESFEGIGDGASFVSTNSSRPFSYAAGHRPHAAEGAFQQRLADHLKPGSTIKLTADSVTQDCVTIEVQGDPEANVEPPPGFSLTAIDRQSQGQNSSTFVFQRQSRQRRHGRFEVENSAFPNPDEVDDMDSEGNYHLLEPSALADYPDEDLGQPKSQQSDADAGLGASDENGDPASSKLRVIANQKRPRSPWISRSEQTDASVNYSGDSSLGRLPKVSKPGNQVAKSGLDQSPLRRAMSKSKSVKNLVEFWSREKQKSLASTNRLKSIPDSEETTIAYRTNYPTTNNIPPSSSQTQLDDAEDLVRDATDRAGRFLGEPRPMSSMSHHRHRSSMYSVASMASETSLILKPLFVNDVDDPVSFLHRDGTLPSHYPRDSFSANTARFARFSLASYGSNFLRLTGTFSESELTSLNETYLPEHHSFSTYINLPPSTVLLSSYVDSQVGTTGVGTADAGMPLVHYVSLDHACKAVVLTCRGTLGFEDVLADMTCDYIHMTWQSKTYQVHEGIYNSAKRLFTSHDGRILATIKAALEEFEDYGLVLCGHSLGGAVASVLSILLAQSNTTSAGGASKFVTARGNIENGGSVLPPNRPIHAYAYGPAACVSPELQLATRGLVTSIVQGNDTVPFLSLGTLRDFQAMALAFKFDSHVAKAEVRKRIWEGLVGAFKQKSGLASSGLGFSQDWLGDVPAEEEEDHWAWSALKSLRASFLADKLFPPGEVYLVESASVLQRHAFVSPSVPEEEPSQSREEGSRKRAGAVNVLEEDEGRRSFKPATHITFRHVKDVEKRFGEIKFAAGMFADHFPARYLRALEDLEKAIGV